LSSVVDVSKLQNNEAIQTLTRENQELETLIRENNIRNEQLIGENNILQRQIERLEDQLEELRLVDRVQHTRLTELRSEKTRLKEQLDDCEEDLLPRKTRNVEEEPEEEENEVSEGEMESEPEEELEMEEELTPDDIFPPGYVPPPKFREILNNASQAELEEMQGYLEHLRPGEPLPSNNKNFSRLYRKLHHRIPKPVVYFNRYRNPKGEEHRRLTPENILPPGVVLPPRFREKLDYANQEDLEELRGYLEHSRPGDILPKSNKDFANLYRKLSHRFYRARGSIASR
jgi:hypothetical protein